MKRIIYVLTAIFLFANVATGQKVGDAAPDFTLKDLNEQNFKLSDQKGKVVLIFFVGYNCSLCIGSSPSVKSTILDKFAGNNKFQTVVIDTWNGSKSGVQGFSSSTKLDAHFLQKGRDVATNWSITYDRLAVVDAEGKIVFKGTRAARSDAEAAKSTIETALKNVATNVVDLEKVNGFSVSQNFPNPLQNRTKIEFTVGENSFVSLAVYDIAGKKVLEPVQQEYSAGKYEVNLDGNQLKKGIYFYRFEAGGFSAIKKMVVQ